MIGGIKARGESPPSDIPFLGDYVPNKAQLPFHKSRADLRGLFAANRSGKSCSGVNDILMDGTGMHPFRPRAGWPWDPEAEWAHRAARKTMTIWDAAPDFPNVWEPNTLPEYQRWLGSFPHTWHEGKRKLTLHCRMGGYEWDVNIYAKSYESGRKKFQASGVAMIRFDEECDLDIYTESTLRISSLWSLNIMFTLTPVEGITWIYDEIYEPWEMGDAPPWVECFHATIWDNAQNLGAVEIEKLERQYPPGHPEREIRLFGRFRQRSGLVFPTYDEQKVVVPDFWPWEVPDFEYTPYRMIDLGIRNPFVCLWAATDPYGRTYFFDEYGVTDLPLRMQARNVIDRHPQLPPVQATWIDPSAATRDMSSASRKIDELAAEGLYCVPGPNDHSLTHSRVSLGLMPTAALGTPPIRICKRCSTLRRQLKRYRYQDQKLGDSFKHAPKEKPQDVDNDYVDAIRYGWGGGLPYVNREKIGAATYHGDAVTGY